MQAVTVSRKHGVVGVPYQENLASMFPEAKQMDLGGVVNLIIPHCPAESFLLRKLEYDVPSPILTNYAWPHPANNPPFDAQRNTAAMLSMNSRAYVLNGMGTGKTRAALWAWDYLFTNNLCGKLLVIAPLSTLEFVWKHEIFATLPGRTCAVLYGTKAKRLDRLSEDVDIYVINHDGFGIIKDEIEKRLDINSLVIDELAVYRNGRAERTKRMMKFTERPQIKWAWGMTGGPMPTQVTDVWAQARILTPHRVPKYFGSFQKELMLKVSQFKWIPRDNAIERAFEALKPSVRYTLDEVYELPETVHRTVDVALGPVQAKAYKDMLAHCYAAIQSEEITAANAGGAISKLLQVSCGWVYTSQGNTISLDNAPSIKALVDLTMAGDRKVLVFVPYKHALAGISEAFSKKGVDIDHATVSGDTPAGARAEIFSLFQNTNKYHAIVAHPECLAHGITLTEADTVIWFSPAVRSEIYDQANKRISRVGQKHKQLIIHMQRTPIEKRRYAHLRKQLDTQDSLLELIEAATETAKF